MLNCIELDSAVLDFWMVRYVRVFSYKTKSNTNVIKTNYVSIYLLIYIYIPCLANFRERVYTLPLLFLQEKRF